MTPVKGWSWIAAGLMAMSAGATLAADQCPVPEPGGRYYIVTGPDPRACPSPICGGWFVKEVNKPNSRCSDGVWAAQCHAGEVDLSALPLGDVRRARLQEQFGKGHALVRGRLERRPMGDLAMDVLVADEGWLGQALTKPSGRFVGLKDSGIVCVTAPCPSIFERTLNIPREGERLIDGVDLAASGAPPEKVSAGQQALSKPFGILVAGRLERTYTPTGPSRRRIASEFYLRMAAADLPPPPDGQACGGPTGVTCPAGQFCDLQPAGSCTTPDARGTCRSPPEVCPAIAAPVCGCDGVTYGNDCERQGAGVPLAHEGACAD